MKNLTELATEIYNECLADGEPVSMEEATEMAKAEIGAKNIIGYTATEKVKGKSKPHTVKVSDEKKALFDSIFINLDRCEGVEPESITILTQNKLIEVKIGDKTFKINISECRNKKK